MECGILYIASGDRYVNEAVFSAKSAKTQMPNIPITIYSDREIESDVFDNVKILQGDHGLGILQPGMLPYDRTLLLDSDTYVYSNIYELFTILDEFDIAAPHEKTRTERLSNRPTENFAYVPQDIPESFPTHQTAVLALKKSNKLDEFLSEWNRLYQSYNETYDGTAQNQPAFRETLYKSDLRIATIPPEYCAWPRDPGFLNGPAKIVHGRFMNVDDIAQVAEAFNATENMRTHTNEKWPLKLREKKGSTLRYRLGRSLKCRGVIGTGRATIDALVRCINKQN